MQRAGIGIGSRAAPYLSNLYLAEVDQRIQGSLEEKPIAAIFRYVDDYLVLYANDLDNKRLQCEMLRCFEDNAQGLSFTQELPEDGHLRFLALSLRFAKGHVCWRYETEQ